MNEADIGRAVGIFNQALHTLKPYVAEVYPALAV